MTSAVDSAFRVDGFHVLITGAGSGIGASSAVVLAKAGAARVFLVGRREAPLEETRSVILDGNRSAKVVCIEADVSASDDRTRIIKTIECETDQLDLLINNAGLYADTPIALGAAEVWRETFSVNVDAPFALIGNSLHLLRRSKHAAVVNVSSTLAEKPIPGASAYNASKAALNQMTRTLALELSPIVRVNAIMPAVVETAMFRNRFDDRAAYEKALEEMNNLHPMGRVGKPIDIAHAVLFLSSPASAWITGAVLPVDGGMLCT